MDIMGGPRQWGGARRTASITVFGLPGTKPLSKKVEDTAEAIRVQRAMENKDVVRGYAETRHKAKFWGRERRAVARIEATKLGLDIRFVVTNLELGSPEWIYDSFYCARGQAENLIKLHKTQLSSDRTSCRSAIANQVRLVLHTAAYWLMLAVRDAIPKERDLAKAEFATLRLKLLKIAARVIEMASRVRLAFAAACPEAQLFAWPTCRAHAARTLNDGAQKPLSPCRFLQRVQKCRSRCGENNRKTNRVRPQPARTEPDDLLASRIDRARAIPAAVPRAPKSPARHTL